jgi:phage terminase large subunit
MATAAADIDSFDWKHPDYVSILAERARLLKRLRSMSHNEVAAIKAFYREHPVEFINDWGMTSDPRNVEVGLPVHVPFLLFPKQAEFVEWVFDRKWRNREDGLAEKSRDMGVSWLCVAIASTCGCSSRHADRVRQPQGGVCRRDRQPEGAVPEDAPVRRPAAARVSAEGWDGGKYMLINNPENGASIIGEAGDNIGRGARTGIYFKDESAFYERSEKIEAALARPRTARSTCRLRTDRATASIASATAGRSKCSRSIGRMIRARIRPGTTSRRDLDPVILAQEVDIDYSASVSNAWIDGALFEAAFSLGPADVEAIGPKVLGVDAAHEGDDCSCDHVPPRPGEPVDEA